MSPNEWLPFLSVSAEVAATLTGLVFVAVSINLKRILEIPGLTSLVAESLVQLLGAVFVALFLLIPYQTLRLLGGEMLGVVLVIWTFQLWLQIAYLRTDTGHPLRWGVRRMIRTACACTPFLIAAVLLLRSFSSAFFWVALGVLFSVIAGVANAWVLLVEVVR